MWINVFFSLPLEDGKYKVKFKAGNEYKELESQYEVPFTANALPHWFIESLADEKIKVTHWFKPPKKKVLKIKFLTNIKTNGNI